MGNTVRPNELVERTLLAVSRVPYKRLPVDADEPVGYFEPGNVVGVIYSFIKPDPPRNANLYWQFNTSNGKSYYVEHRSEYFDFNHLIDQGVLTDPQRREVQRIADQLVWERGLELTGNVLTEAGSLVKNNFGTIVKFAGAGIIVWLGINALK